MMEGLVSYDRDCWAACKSIMVMGLELSKSIVANFVVSNICFARVHWLTGLAHLGPPVVSEAVCSHQDASLGAQVPFTLYSWET